MLEKRIFTSQKLRIHLDDGPKDVDALVSESGAKNVFREASSDELAETYMHRELSLEYRGHQMTGRLSKEINSNGTSYHVRFTRVDSEALDAIRKDVEAQGLPSPWKRSFARIPATAESLPVPSLAVLYLKNQEFFLGVRNFTVGGVLLEYLGGDLSDLEPSVKIEFDLVTNFGDKITQLEGRVAHLTIEHSTGVDRLLIGVQFLSMSFLNETKYKQMIREYCTGIKAGRS
jgi:hypothetical protein